MNTLRNTMIATAALLSLAVISTVTPGLGARHARATPAAQQSTDAAAFASQRPVGAMPERLTVASAASATGDTSVPSAYEVFKHRDSSAPEVEAPTF